MFLEVGMGLDFSSLVGLKGLDSGNIDLLHHVGLDPGLPTWSGVLLSVPVG